MCYETTSIDRRWYSNRRTFWWSIFADSNDGFPSSQSQKILIDFPYFLRYGKRAFFPPFPKAPSCDLYFHSVCEYFNTIESYYALRLSGIFSEAFAGTLQKFTKASSKLFCDELPVSVWGLSMENGRILPQTHTKGANTHWRKSRENSSKWVLELTEVLEWGQMPDKTRNKNPNWNNFSIKIETKLTWVRPFFRLRIQNLSQTLKFFHPYYVVHRCQQGPFAYFQTKTYINYHRIIIFLYLLRTRVKHTSSRRGREAYNLLYEQEWVETRKKSLLANVMQSLARIFFPHCSEDDEGRRWWGGKKKKKSSEGSRWSQARNCRSLSMSFFSLFGTCKNPIWLWWKEMARET